MCLCEVIGVLVQLESFGRTEHWTRSGRRLDYSHRIYLLPLEKLLWWLFEFLVNLFGLMQGFVWVLPSGFVWLILAQDLVGQDVEVDCPCESSSHLRTDLRPMTTRRRRSRTFETEKEAF